VIRSLPFSLAMVLVLGSLGSFTQAGEMDKVLDQENKQLGVKYQNGPAVDDLSYLRRVTVDIIGRIPTNDEINEFLAMPEASRRTKWVDRLLADPRFADRWTVFFGDMLRLRSGVPGGAQLTAYVHNAIEDGMAYDVLTRNLIRTNGRANTTPEVGFVLGDDANPLAMAAVTSQVFLGVRIGCAECHDHPFDSWTRESFYGLAAFYGKTRRIENMFTNSVYTTEAEETAVLWPPEGVGKPEDRKAMKPTFPFTFDSDERAKPHLDRLVALRKKQAEERARLVAASQPDANQEVDNILETAGQLRDDDAPTSAVNANLEAKREIRRIDIQKSLYRDSQLRDELGKLVTDPRNRYYSRSFMNRLWAELVGRGFIEPIDDFREDNQPSHPQTLDYLADEFVASGYDLRSAIKLVVTTDAYQRQHIEGVEELIRDEMERSFVVTPMRRMLSESLYDSIITAGHLFSIKHGEGENIKTRTEEVQVRVEIEGGAEAPVLASIQPKKSETAMKGMAGMAGQGTAQRTGYDLEKAIEVDFSAALEAEPEAPMVEQMAVMSKEELEAQQMMMAKGGVSADGKYKYVMKTVTTKFDDNPQYGSSLRMAAPAADGHFVRVFGQPSRDSLGDLRDPSPSMRQALMILNGSLTHEASRVGKLETMYDLLVGDKADLNRATRLAYREILTRDPSAQEISEAKEIIAMSSDPVEGMADLRWVLLNCHEFRFLP
jgi:hypothetical protein